MRFQKHLLALLPVLLVCISANTLVSKGTAQSTTYAVGLAGSTQSNQKSPALTLPNGDPYPYGLMPEGTNFEPLRKAYDRWKKRYVTSRGAPVGKRVLWDDGASTVSEGIGYGMLMAVYFGDRELFNDFWAYYQEYGNEHGLMNWKIGRTGSVEGKNAATDADEDVAFALVMAYHKWGDDGEVNYKKDARYLLRQILNYEVEYSSNVLKPGDAWGGSMTTNPSYFAPGYYRVFHQFMNRDKWLGVAEKCYDILEAARHSGTGLVPDWCQADGTIPARNVNWAKKNGTTYSYDAARTPWRIALDYLWFGNERAKEFCTKITGFVDSIGVKRIRDGYYLDGRRIGENHNSTFVGTFGVGIMATDSSAYQRLLNEAYQDNVLTTNNNYFNDCLRILTLMVQTGNFHIPEAYREEE